MIRPAERFGAVTLLAGPLGTIACYGTPEAGNPLDDLTGDQRDRFKKGRVVFNQDFTPKTGLGPLFNNAGCASCHDEPVPGGGGSFTQINGSVLRPNGFCDPLVERGGPVFQLSVTPALEAALGIDAEPIPPEAARGKRTTPDVFGFGLLDPVPESTMLALADPDDADGDGVSGRVNRFFDGRVGRFGRKALTPTLAEFNEGAFHVEQGVTVPNFGRPPMSSARCLTTNPPHNMMFIMRYPDGHKEAVRERIVQAASRALRRYGLEGVSIPALMKPAGLTHGGFYTYFKNRDELVAEAILSAAAETADGTFSEELPLRETVDRYLSKGHLEHPEEGCVLAALGTDGVRQPPLVRGAFAEVARGFLRLTERKVHPRGRTDRLSDEALVRAATMVGAVVLGRLVSDAALSERILAAARTTTST